MAFFIHSRVAKTSLRRSYFYLLGEGCERATACFDCAPDSHTLTTIFSRGIRLLPSALAWHFLFW